MIDVTGFKVTNNVFIDKIYYLCHMQPIGNKIIVKPIKTENVSKSGLIIIKEETTETGEIHEVSVDLKETPLSKGQKVLYPKGVGSRVEVDGEELLIMNHHEIWLIL